MPWSAFLQAAAPYAIPAATAGIGGLASLLGKKKKAQTTQLPTLTPQQQGWQSQGGQMAMQGLLNPYEGFNPIAQQARSRFQTQTVPSLAERFTSFGQGGQRSSDFMGAMAGAGTDLEEGLAAQQSQYGLQNRGLLQQLLGMNMQPSFENIYQPEQTGGMQRFGANLLGQSPQMFASAYQSQGLEDIIKKYLQAKGGK